jgi:hypothetical protein
MIKFNEFINKIRQTTNILNIHLYKIYKYKKY